MKNTRREFVKNTAVVAGGISLLSTGCSTGEPTMSFKEYRQFDALGLAELVKTGEVSAAELLENAIARTEAVNPAINAVVLEHYDMARETVKNGLPDGPFSGVPYLLKDLGVAMKGTVTTDGSVFNKDNLYDYDSTITARYKKAGLVIFGKANSPEFGGSPSTENTLFGATHNPWDLTRSAGGSSGGSAAAVAAGILPAAHATDGGGSIRIPGSCCGLFAMKPTRGRTPQGPLSYEKFDGLTIGHAVSRSVRDNAGLLDISQGPELGDAYATHVVERPYLEEIKRPVGKLRIALMTKPILSTIEVDQECVTAAENAAKLCESLGHSVELATPPVNVSNLYKGLGGASCIVVAEAVAAQEAKLGRKVTPDDLEEATWDRLQKGRAITGLEHAQFRSYFHEGSRVLGRFMQDYDVILSPTMGMVPAKLGVLSMDQPYSELMLPGARAAAFTGLYNMTGQPAMSVPLHWTEEGVPVGVQFAGRFGDEATLYRLAAQLEEAAPWFDKIAAV